MLQIENLTFRIGPRVLLDGASAAVPAGHRVGLVGRNGTGKTTLLKLITGGLEADDGSISIPPRWRLGMTRQEAPEGKARLIDSVLAADAELSSLQAEAETAQDPDRIAHIHERLAAKHAYSAPARAAGPEVSPTFPRRTRASISNDAPYPPAGGRITRLAKY